MKERNKTSKDRVFKILDCYERHPSWPLYRMVSYLKDNETYVSKIYRQYDALKKDPSINKPTVDHCGKKAFIYIREYMGLEPFVEEPSENLFDQLEQDSEQQTDPDCEVVSDTQPLTDAINAGFKALGESILILSQEIASLRKSKIANEDVIIQKLDAIKDGVNGVKMNTKKLKGGQDGRYY